jgi:hypothetical protein
MNLTYLTITPNYSWDLKKIYMQEGYRRSARFVKATAGHTILSSLDTEDKLFDYWLCGTNGGRITMFNILFYFILFFCNNLFLYSIVYWYLFFIELFY